jgi:hypothetical protein
LARTIAAALSVFALAQTATAQPANQLTLSLSDATLGFIAAHVTGPAGATVEVTDAATQQPVAQVTLGADGTAQVPKLSAWQCTPRARSFTASLAPPNTTSAPPATASITTPSCAHRIAWSMHGRATTVSGVRVNLADRWRLGGSKLTVCAQAPLGLTSCTPATIPAGHPSVAFTLPALRPGGWTVTLKAPGQRAASSTVWVSNPNGQPLSLLAAGDSEMVDVGDYIDQLAAPHGVRGYADAKSDSGLENEWFFNWFNEAQRDIARYHPQVTVMFMGANAGFTIGQGPHQVPCCGARWSQLYAQAVERLSAIFMQGQRGVVLWTTLPTPSSGSFKQIFDAVNNAERIAARKLPGRIGLVDANAFFTPGDVYRNTMTWGGSTFIIHQSDGLHLATGGDWAYARFVVEQLQADRFLRPH